tara:strand:- start:3581 stop:3838 length:258 start_codon:yes stop_codon:yes gene_type:complete
MYDQRPLILLQLTLFPVLADCCASLVQVIAISPAAGYHSRLFTARAFFTSWSVPALSLWIVHAPLISAPVKSDPLKSTLRYKRYR